MPRGYQSMWGASKTTLAMREFIKQKYGEELIADAKQRLCAKCKIRNCFLLPITTDGKDCPYFRQREEKE